MHLSVRLRCAHRRSIKGEGIITGEPQEGQGVELSSREELLCNAMTRLGLSKRTHEFSN